MIPTSQDDPADALFRKHTVAELRTMQKKMKLVLILYVSEMNALPI
jgi:hypothetical protein